MSKENFSILLFIVVLCLSCLRERTSAFSRHQCSAETICLWFNMSPLNVIIVACFMVSCHFSFVFGGNQRNEEVEQHMAPFHQESCGMLTEKCATCCVCMYYNIH